MKFYCTNYNDLKTLVDICMLNDYSCYVTKSDSKNENFIYLLIIDNVKKEKKIINEGE